MQAVKRPKGAMPKEIDRPYATVISSLARMVERGEAFKVKVSKFETRYFDTEAKAKKCLGTVQEVREITNTKAAKKFDPDAPMVYPPNWKGITVCPSPGVFLKTNTHSDN